jgi:YidC/Oxa1 family membrane protein insertase
MTGSARMAKKQKELREKYGNNREKLQEEMNKLYEKEGVKPMGGCLTTIIPMIVLLGIFYAVAYPLTNTLHLDGSKVNEALSYVNAIPGYVHNVGNATYQEVSLLRVFPQIQNTEFIQGIFSGDEISRILEFAGSFNIFGSVDLLTVPSNLGFWSPYLLFPVLCFVSNVGSSWVMQRVNRANQAMQQQGCMKAMIYILPLFSAYIAFSVPAAVSFYWIISAIISLGQSIVLNKVFSPAKMTANSEARHAALMFENEAKVPYVYAPKKRPAAQNTSKKKKK